MMLNLTEPPVTADLQTLSDRNTECVDPKQAERANHSAPTTGGAREKYSLGTSLVKTLTPNLLGSRLSGLR